MTVPATAKPKRKRESRTRPSPKSENQNGNRSKIVKRHTPLLEDFLGSGGTLKRSWVGSEASNSANDGAGSSTRKTMT